MQPVSLMSLYELGTHRGNSRTRLNPRLKKQIYGFQKGLCLIDLVQTIEYLERTVSFFYKLGQKRRQILLVGTSKHLQNKIPDYSNQFTGGSMPYVNNRWLGGTLTNWSTIKKTLKNLEKLENIESNTEFFDALPRNQQLEISREKEKLDKFFGGLKHLKTNKPGCVLVLDAISNPIAIEEAEVMKIPSVLLTNTYVTTLPKNLEYTLVCNTNSLTAVDFIVSKLIDAYNEGLASSLKKEVDVDSKEETKVAANV